MANTPLPAAGKLGLALGDEVRVKCPVDGAKRKATVAGFGQKNGRKIVNLSDGTWEYVDDVLEVTDRPRLRIINEIKALVKLYCGHSDFWPKLSAHIDRVASRRY